MAVKIYRDVAFAPDEQIGYIDADGRIYALQAGQPDQYIGYLDYEEGEVLTSDDELMGYITEEAEVIASYEDEDINIGYVGENGGLYLYGEDEEDLYVGKVDEMEDSAEGAAALLFFFDEDGEIIEDEEEGLPFDEDDVDEAGNSV
jgi:hypothetical protein